YKLFRSPDFSLLKYSTGHCIDLITGMHALVEKFRLDNKPKLLGEVIGLVKKNLDNPDCRRILSRSIHQKLSAAEVLSIAHFLRYKFKRSMLELIHAFAKIDAWRSMSEAAAKLQLHFPDFVESDTPVIEAESLYHILLPDPVPYSITLNDKNNFLFLTSANMAGKSTFIKSIGIAVYLAHTGMAVPAASMKLSLFDGLLSNINVTDNILKGESYFYNEVRRISDTVRRINDSRRWLILIDELFKGTNVQDAMKCSITVIEGLLKVKTSIFILSTHLYEIADNLKHHPGILFRYFETTIRDEKPVFHYKLKEGISNDRLGYLILKQSGVVEMLKEL
ncbi:MAG: DNA mismatch repair protein MutS, partial [Chitinophagaceae bacterium]